MAANLGLAHLGSDGGATRPQPRQVARGTLTSQPASESDPLFVVLEGGSLAWPYEVAAGHWESRGTSLPVKGDACVVLLDTLGDAWVVGWDGRTSLPASPVPASPAAGDLLVGQGGAWARLAVGTAGQELLVRSDGTVKWTSPPVYYLSAWGAGQGGDDTPIIHAVRDAAPAGAIIQFQPGASYNTTGLTMNKRQTWHAHGAYTKLANNSNAIMVNVTASGCRIRGGEWDGNRVNQTGTNWGITANQTSDFIAEEVWSHSCGGPCLADYDSDNVRFYRCRANDSAPAQHCIFGQELTANRSIFHVIDCVVDRSTESATGFSGRGVKVDRTNSAFSFTDIKITGVVKQPAVNNTGAICVECWGGCANVNIDVQTEGGGMGVSVDGVDGGSVNMVAKGPIQNGIEIATAAKHLSVTGSVDGQNVCGAGIQITNTTCEELTIDMTVDNVIARCVKAQNATGVTLKGNYRQRVSGQDCMEIINCSDWQFDCNLDGRNDAGTASARDGIDFDHSYNMTGFLKIAHFTRTAVGFYSFNVGSKVDALSLWGSITDCTSAPITNWGFSSAADLGSNVRFHFDTDVFGPSVASAAALSLPWHADVIKVTGTTGITSIPAAQTQKGREITLIFTGILTVTSGSNLILNGNFTTAANSVLRLLSDGTNWYEVSRKP